MTSLLLAVLAAYLIATIHSILAFINKRRSLQRVAEWSMGAGFVLHTAALIADWVVDNSSTGVRRSCQVIIVQPNTMGAGKIGVQDLELIQVACQALAEDLDGSNGLRFGFRYMHLNSHPEVTCQVPATFEELTGAMCRDCRCKCGADSLAIIWPMMQPVSQHGDLISLGSGPFLSDPLVNLWR